MSLAAFKRRVLVGTKIDAVGFQNPNATGRRVVTKVQGNGFWYLKDGYDKRMWCPWPSARHVRIVSPDCAELFMPDGKPMSTLTIAD